MKHSPFSKDLFHRKGSKHHHCPRFRDAPVSHKLKHKDYHGMEHDHHRMRRFGHGHHELHEISHGHFKRFGKDHMHHKKKHGYFIHHRMGYGFGKHHKMAHNHERHHQMRHGFEKMGCGRHEKCCEKGALKVVSKYEPKTKVQVTRENNKFKIYVDTSYYQPDEISVRISGGQIVVSAQHESRDDNLHEFHEMHRSFSIPDDISPDTITSNLDSEGKLTIESPIIIDSEESWVDKNIEVIRSDE